MTLTTFSYRGTIFALGLLIVTALAIRVWNNGPQPAPRPAAPASRPYTAPPELAIPLGAPRSAQPAAIPEAAAPAALEIARVPAPVELRPTHSPRFELAPAPILSPSAPPSAPSWNAEPAARPAPLLPGPTRQAAARWPRAEALRRELETLRGRPATSAWAEAALEQLAQLHAQPQFASEESRARLANLETLRSSARDTAATLLVKSVGPPPIVVSPSDTRWLPEQLLQVQYSVTRRIEVWDLVHRQARTAQAVVPLDRAEWPRVLAAVEAYLAGPQREAWRTFLELPKIEKLAATSATVPTAEQAALARTVLARLDDPAITTAQYAYLSHKSLLALAEALACWAYEPIDYARLVADLERLETRTEPAAELAVMEHLRRLHRSPRAGDRELAERIELHYRNANLRLAVTDDCLNRLLPLLEPFEHPVSENILGAETRGHTRGRSRLLIRLLPDANRLNMGIEAQGEIDSDTRSTHGPVTFFNQGRSWFQARKGLRLGRDGLETDTAAAQAESNSWLTGLETDFDGLPLLGGIARHVAEQQYNQRLAEARMVTDRRVAGMAEQKFEAEFAQQMRVLESRVDRHVFTPLDRLHLELAPIQLQTTDRRITARYRLAGSRQLGAYTARPRAPGDALLSVQVHESAVNNLLEGLGFAGRRVELHELYHEIATLFGADEIPEPEEIPAGVVVHFAAEQPLRVRFEEGRMAVCIRLAELSHERRRWRNFEVRGYYAPDTTKLSADLVRDGHIELSGENIRIGDRVTLSGVFSRVFSKNRPLSLLNALAEHPRLQDLGLSQYAVRDGWLGLALSERRAERDLVAEEPHQARR